MNESGKVSRAIYVVPVIYVLGMYMMPVLFWLICNMQESTESFDAGWIMVMPIVLGLVNLAVVLILGKRISRVQLLICTSIIKYALTNLKNKYVLAALVSIVGILLHGFVDTVFFRPQIQFTFWIMVAVIRSFYGCREN